MIFILLRVNHYAKENTLLNYDYILHVSVIMHFTQFKGAQGRINTGKMPYKAFDKSSCLIMEGCRQMIICNFKTEGYNINWHMPPLVDSLPTTIK